MSPWVDGKRKRDSDSDFDSDGSEQAEERAEHHYMMRVNDDFDAGRYQVVEQLGKGTFGRVVEMYDREEKRAVAVKVVRAVEKYAKEAEIEADILRELQRTLPGEEVDGATRFPIGRLYRTFESRGHVCLVFEKLGPSLYHGLKATRDAARREAGRDGSRGGAGCYFSLARIAAIAADSFDALAHMHAVRLAHTDLKPENILFNEAPPPGAALPASYDVSLIDFGGATWEDEHHSSIVCTRQYAEITLHIVSRRGLPMMAGTFLIGTGRPR